MYSNFERPCKRPEGRLPTLEDIKKLRLQLLVVIVDRTKKKKVTEVIQEKHVHLHFVCLAEGTASSEIMDVLGLGSTDKAVTLCIAPKSMMPKLLDALDRGLGLRGAGKGIAFTIPLSGASTPVFHMLDEELRESLQNEMHKEVEKMSTAATHDLILAVINQGCSEDLMAAAKTGGATGGTVIHARRISTEDSVKFFGIAIQAEKEVVAIITAREKKKDIMSAIGKACGMRSEAKGIFLSLPVDSIVGIPGLGDASAEDL